MKIAYNHLIDLLIQKPKIDEISEKLFQLGHEHEVQDSIFEIEFTPNRGDCLSLYGLARDLNVFYETNLQFNTYEDKISKLDLNFKNNVINKCSQISFLNIEIEGKVEDYQDYLENYFKDLNINKNNFFTDVSNYLAYEMGQPTHCYDYLTIGDDITLTDNISEVDFNTLLGNKINLDKSDLVFTSNDKVINLAGIVGSIETSCTNKTKNVLIECASFNPESIMGKSVKYNLVSEASHKFERGVDSQSQEKVLRRFIQIVNDHANIKKVSICKNIYQEYKEVEIDIDIDEINNILGTEETIQTYIDKLSKLGFSFKNKIKVPSFRNDIKHQNDLAEEFARVIGYDNIPKKNIYINKSNPDFSSFEKNICLFLIDNGFFEVINFPFSSVSNKSAIKLDNPLDSNRTYLRTNLKDSLVSNLIYNQKRQKDSIKLFEISDVYSNDMNKVEKRLCLIVSGRKGFNYKEFSKPLDKNYLIELFKSLNIDIEEYVVEIPISELDTKYKSKVFYLEIDIINILKYFKKYKRISSPQTEYAQYEQISEFPSSTRDLSFSVKNVLSLKILQESILNFHNELIRDCFVFDFYKNDKNQEIKIGFRIIFQCQDKTITDKEINIIMDEIINLTTEIDSVSIPGI